MAKKRGAVNTQGRFIHRYLWYTATEGQNVEYIPLVGLNCWCYHAFSIQKIINQIPFICLPGYSPSPQNTQQHISALQRCNGCHYCINSSHKHTCLALVFEIWPQGMMCILYTWYNLNNILMGH